MKGKAKSSLASPSEPRRKQKTIQNYAVGLHKNNNNNLFHLLQCCQISMLLNCILRGISRGTVIHINVFLAYLLVQELLFNKNHFLEFLSVGCNLALQQLNIFAANLSTNLVQPFHACWWTTRKRKCLALRVIFIAKFHQRNQPH